MLTVAITTYNRWGLCLKALRSVCGQEGVDMEVVLVDDCSADPMPVEIKEFIDKNHVKYIRHKTNKGLAAARNTAIKAARGKYFSFCDDDDQWPADMASGLVRAMENAPEGVGMGVGMPLARQRACEDLLEGYPKLTNLMLHGFTPPVGGQIYLTDLVREAGGYTPEVKSGVDHDLWINLLKANPGVAVSWGEPVKVGANPGRERMTTNENKRRQGVHDALNIWQPKITAALGENFYRHFYSSYDQYLDYKFFMQAVKAGNYPQVIYKAANPRVIKMFMEHVFRKISRRQKCSLFPGFGQDITV